LIIVNSINRNDKNKSKNQKKHCACN
jgi:hypothetical protein